MLNSQDSRRIRVPEPVCLILGKRGTKSCIKELQLQSFNSSLQQPSEESLEPGQRRTTQRWIPKLARRATPRWNPPNGQDNLVGLSIFESVGDSNLYLARTYNFYICPRSFGNLDQRFLCQASCLEFLTSHKFDFNKFIYEGISCLTLHDEARVRQDMREGILLRALERDVSFREEDLIRSITSQVMSWNICNRTVGDSLEINCDNISLVGKYVLNLEIRGRFQNIWTYQSDRFLVKIVSPEERLSLSSEQSPDQDQSLEEDIISELLGFSKVIRMIISAKKTLVGHNCLLDIIKIYHQFYNPLPESYSDFKIEVTSIFPKIYDTKQVAFKMKPLLQNSGLDQIASAFDSTGLDKLYEQLKMTKSKFEIMYSPRIKNAEGFHKYEGIHMPHEAGYDAFLTGSIFIKTAHVAAAASYLSINRMKPLKFIEHEACVKAFVNQLNIGRASIPYMNLSGPDPESQRPARLHIMLNKNCANKSINTLQIAEQFSRYGSVDVRPVSSTSAIIAVTNYRTLNDILLAFKDDSELTVTKYNPFRHNNKILTAMGICGVSVILIIGVGIYSVSSK